MVNGTVKKQFAQYFKVFYIPADLGWIIFFGITSRVNYLLRLHAYTHTRAHTHNIRGGCRKHSNNTHTRAYAQSHIRGGCWKVISLTKCPNIRILYGWAENVLLYNIYHEKNYFYSPYIFKSYNKRKIIKIVTGFFSLFCRCVWTFFEGLY